MTGVPLLERWIALAGTRSARYGSELVDSYRESWRRYHTLEHLEHVLDVVDDLADEAENARTVRFAAWFHDAVYEIGTDARLSNEERSARLAEAVLSRIGEPDATVRDAARLVRLTEGHAPDPADRNGAVLCDADLAILGCDRDGYRRYRTQIRDEYRHIPGPTFRSGRAAILRGFLAQPFIYRTERARERYEEAARANLADELALHES
jgi:predicted metal-dependent HD superfamily phosphohydrolase